MYDRSLRVFGSTLELLEGLLPTPLVKLSRLSAGSTEFWAKLEFFNPFSRSVKDRAAWGMLSAAVRRGKARNRVYEATSGNLGIALAAIAAASGIRFRAYIPRNKNVARTLLRLLGAEVVEMGDFVGEDLVNAARRDAQRDGALYLNQYENEDNPRAQERLAMELLVQLEAAGVRELKGVVVGTGSLGQLVALSRVLGGRTSIVAATPRKDERIPGLRRERLGSRRLEADLVVEVGLDEALSAVVELARREGILAGPSSGAVLAAARKAAGILGEGVYALVFADDVFKYLDVIDDYMASRGL